jgi:hypothetical protein
MTISDLVGSLTILGTAGRGGAHTPEPGSGAGLPRPDGRPGLAGADGISGRDGRARPAPPVFVNERAIEPMPGPAEIPPPDMVWSLAARRGGTFTSATEEDNDDDRPARS